MNRLKKGDNIIVIAGKDKGRKGVVKSFVNDGYSVLIEGVNIVKKAIKSDPNKNIEGGIIEKELGINTSKIAVFNQVTQKPDRIGYKFVDGKKNRYFKSNNKFVDL